MEDDHVLSALRTRRAQLDGELHAGDRQGAKLRLDLDAIDRAFRVFDPEAAPEKIKPKRGTFAATFLVATLAALEMEGVRLEDL